MEKKSNEQKKQENVILYQLLQRRLEELLGQKSLLDRKSMEIESTKNALEYLKKTKKPNDIMIPIGSECFIHGSVDKLEKILVNVGSNVMTEKAVEDVIKILDKQEKNVENVKKGLDDQINEVVKKMNEIVLELQEQGM